MEPRKPYPTDLRDTEWELLQPYVPAAKRGGQPPSYYADRATFAARLDRDIEAKRRLIARMKLQM